MKSGGQTTQMNTSEYNYNDINTFLWPLFEDDNVYWTVRSYNVFSNAIACFNIKRLEDFFKLEDYDWFGMKNCGASTLNVINGVLDKYKKKIMAHPVFDDLPMELMSMK